MIFAFRPALRCLGIAMLAASISGACARSRPYYELEFITIDHIAPLSDGRVSIEYHTLTESMFHSPGVDFVRQGDALEVRALRVFYKDAGDPQIVANSGSEAFRRRVELPLGTARRVVLADAISKRTIWDQDDRNIAARD